MGGWGFSYTRRIEDSLFYHKKILNLFSDFNEEAVCVFVRPPKRIGEIAFFTLHQSAFAFIGTEDRTEVPDGFHPDFPLDSRKNCLCSFVLNLNAVSLGVHGVCVCARVCDGSAG